MKSGKRWVFAPLDKAGAAALAEESGLSPFLALLLTARGITTAEEAEQFLGDGELTDDPFAFADMDAAVYRVQQAIDEGEKIMVFGDYDADGVTATVLLYSYLKYKGADVDFRLPRRDGEGYGLHTSVVQELAAMGTQLIITVDNGITAVEEAAAVKALGMDMVITDHHMPQETLPDAVAVVDPHRPDCESACKDYAGVGVAFKLVCALEGDADWVLEQYGDLVAIGTLADVMALRGENRVLVRAGLAKLNRAPRPGLAALLDAAGGSRKQTSTSAVFTIAPRINAAGRLGDPTVATSLLLAETEAEAALLAEQINNANADRQRIEAEILTELDRLLAEHPELLTDRVLVVAGHNWHNGVIGILAARLLERTGKPCILLSVDEDGHAKGSGRSISGFSLLNAITACAEVLENFGGHELAAGVGLHESNIDEFRRRINAYAAEHHPVMPVPTLSLDFKVSPAQIDLGKVDQIARLEPFGSGNPLPVFGLYNMQVTGIMPVGGGKHLRLNLTRDNVTLQVMWFRATPETCPFTVGDTVNAAVTFDRNEFRGVESVSVQIKDIVFADLDTDETIAARQDMDCLARGEQPLAHTAAALTPTREQCGVLYKYLRAAGGFAGRPEKLFHTLHEAFPITGTLLCALEILHQAELLSITEDAGNIVCTLLPATGKADLTATPLMKTLISFS